MAARSRPAARVAARRFDCNAQLPCPVGWVAVLVSRLRRGLDVSVLPKSESCVLANSRIRTRHNRDTLDLEHMGSGDQWGIISTDVQKPGVLPGSDLVSITVYLC